MEEFSDLDDETGTNIANFNNIDISRNLVESIEYQTADTGITSPRKSFNFNYNNLRNENFNNNNINSKLSLENDAFSKHKFYQKKYKNDFDRFIDDDFSYNRINVDLINNKNDGRNINKISETNENLCKEVINKKVENVNYNRFIEITKNYNKINFKRDDTVESNEVKLDINHKNIEKKNSPNSENVFASNLFYNLINIY